MNPLEAVGRYRGCENLAFLQDDREPSHTGTEVSVSFYLPSEPTARELKDFRNQGHLTHPTFEFLLPSWTCKAARPAWETLYSTLPAKPSFRGTPSFKDKQRPRYTLWNQQALVQILAQATTAKRPRASQFTAPSFDFLLCKMESSHLLTLSPLILPIVRQIHSFARPLYTYRPGFFQPAVVIPGLWALASLSLHAPHMAQRKQSGQGAWGTGSPVLLGSCSIARSDIGGNVFLSPSITFCFP